MATDEAVDQSQSVSDEELVLTIGPFQFLQNSVVISRPPTYDEWAHAITWCQRAEHAVPFWLGWLVNYGEIFGEAASQVLEASGYAHKTLTNFAYVERHVPVENRREGVPFSHHAEVAPLTPDEQVKYLDKCQDEQITREELRGQIEAAKAGGPKKMLWLVVSCADEDDRSKLYNQFVAEGRAVRYTTKAPAHAQP